MGENTPRITKHCKAGGYAVVYENGYVTILKGTWKIRVLKVTDIPITFDGKATHNIMNTLPAVLATYLFKDISIEDIRTGLSTFVPSPVLTPGRLNMFEFKKCKFLVDFAHNPAGLELLGNFVNKMEGSPKVGIISGTGDRRDEDIRKLGSLSTAYFDEIIIRCDKNLRGRTAEEIVNLLEQGIEEGKTRDIPVQVIYKEQDAIMSAYNNATPGTLITIMCDVVSEALDFIKDLKAKEDAGII